MEVPFFSDFGAEPPKPAEAFASHAVADFAFVNAPNLDHDGAYPEQEVAGLHRAGLLKAPLPRAYGGAEPQPGALSRWLRIIGGGSLALGRLYEGHVNALGLIVRYGDAPQIARAANEAAQGQLFGVWNTDDGRGLRLVRAGADFVLDGGKALASGAGHIARPLVTANDDEGRRLMVTPRIDLGGRADLSGWTAQGMRASATGAVDFSGVRVAPNEILGAAGDYERQPYFSGGAWRFCAVQLGGMETLLDLLRQHLRHTGRGRDAHQAARLGDAAIAVQSARLWVESAAQMAEAGGAGREAGQIVAYVNFARLAVERAGLLLMELIQRSVGLQSFLRPNPIERVSRDLATYLRQPAPDRASAIAAAWTLEKERPAFDLWA